MSIPKPFFRIWRPWESHMEVSLGYASTDYVRDRRYAVDRVSCVRAFELLQEELLKLFEYIEPAIENNTTYSHQLYQLLLRACTEVEAMCKAILAANGYSKGGNWNMGDYRKIEPACRLSQYAVVPLFWKWEHPIPDKFPLVPFFEWNAIGGGSLPWYQAYNAVKHDRQNQFPKANLENVVNAIAAVFVLLFAQFNWHCFDAFHDAQLTRGTNGGFFHPKCLFGIRPPTWDRADCYTETWLNTYTSEPFPYQQYSFG